MSLINDALKRTKQNQQQSGKKPVIPGAGGGAPLQPVSGREPGSKGVIWIPALLVLIIAGFWFFRRSATSESPRSVDSKSAQPAQPAQANPIERAAATAQKWADRQDDRAAGKPSSIPSAPTKTLSITAKPEPASTSSPQIVADIPSRISTPTMSPPAAVAESSSSATIPSPPAAVTPAVTVSLPNVKPGDSTTSSATAPQSPSVPVVAEATPPPPATEMKLQGIFFRLKKPSALINGRTVTIGDDVDGARVIAIERQSVKLMLSGKTTVLTLR